MLRRILPLSFLFLIAGASTMPFFPGSEALDEILGAGPQVGGWGLGGNPRPGSPLAFFEFAPSNGAGLRTACGCAAVTGAKGEAVTWTRASSAMCTKSASETSIANGDLVLCGNNLPRVMSLGGPLGVLVESSRTNTVLQSEAFDNASWLKVNAAVTADQGVSPTGITTMDRAPFGATTAGQEAVTYSPGGCSAGVCSCSVFVRGFSGSGTIDIGINTGGGVVCANCNYTSGSTARCKLENVTVVSSGNFIVGNETASCGTNRPINDVLLWGGQCEAGAYATSYIPTTTVAATRAVDVGIVPFTTAVPSGSLAITTNLEGATGDEGYLGICGGTTTGINGSVGFGPAGANRLYLNNTDISGGALTGGATGVTRRSIFWGTAAGYGLANAPGGTLSGATTTTMTGTPANLQLGDYNCGSAGTRTMYGVLSQVCVDPSPTRCR